MIYLNTTMWFTVYFVAGISVLINLLGDAYYKTVDICEMYPHISFQETLTDEIIMHYTRIPLVCIYVPTLYLLGTYIVVYAAKHWRLVNRGWPLVVDLLSGRWLYHQFFEVFPTFLPFGISDPDVPELLSENEDRDDDKEGYFNDIPLLSMDDEACHKALAKLVQVKMQHANRTISRPDDWLVFDPVQEKLVLQKHITRVGVINGNKVDFRCEETSNGDSDNQVSLNDADAKCAEVMWTGRCVDTEVQAIRPCEFGRHATQGEVSK